MSFHSGIDSRRLPLRVETISLVCLRRSHRSQYPVFKVRRAAVFVDLIDRSIRFSRFAARLRRARCNYTPRGAARGRESASPRLPHIPPAGARARRRGPAQCDLVKAWFCVGHIRPRPDGPWPPRLSAPPPVPERGLSGVAQGRHLLRRRSSFRSPVLLGQDEPWQVVGAADQVT